MKSIYNYLIGSFCLIAALLLVAGCSEEYKYSTDYSFHENVKLKINLVDENDVLSVKLANSTHALTIAVTPEDVFIDSKAYVYGIDDTSVATIALDGTLTLLKVGTTKLTARFRGNQEISTECTLVVEPTLVSDLAIVDGDDIRVEEEKMIDLAPYLFVVPSNADNQVLRYEVKEGYTDNVEVVEGSVIKGLKKGPAVIIVSATDASGVSIELPLTVTGKIPVSEIRLNRAENMNSKTFAIGQVFDLASVLTISPANASDPTLVYELISGADAVTLEDGVLTTVQAGEVELKISAADEFQIAPSHTIKFKVDAALSWFERAFWFVDTTVDYGNGNNYVPDNTTGKPEDLIDGKTGTYLMLVKPGKPAYNGHRHPTGAEFGFIVDLGGVQEFNCFKWRHRNTSTNFQAFTVSLFGSNNNKDFTLIEDDIELKSTTVVEPERDIPLSTYRYIKAIYKTYDPTNGSNLCVAEFYVGKK